MFKIYLFAFTFIVLLTGCKKKNEETDCVSTTSFDRKAMVSHLTTQYIIPAYSNYVSKTKNLNDQTISFIADPTNDGLMSCRDAWKEVAESWQTISFLEFGPAENIGLRSQTNIYPADTTKIKNNISSSNYNLGFPSNYDAKGIQALDYLFFLPDMASESIVQYYTGNSAATEYLKALTNELSVNASSVHNNWLNYSTDFINNTANNAQGSAVSNIVNALSAHYETFVRKGKVGIPVGIFNGFSQTPLPEHTEAYYSGYNVELLTKQIIAISTFINGKSFMEGADGPGLDNYMDYTEAMKDNVNLSVAINDQITAINNAISEINIPLSEYVVSKPNESKALYQSMQKLVPLIKVDLTSALGVLITYQDNDGD